MCPLTTYSAEVPLFALMQAFKHFSNIYGFCPALCLPGFPGTALKSNFPAVRSLSYGIVGKESKEILVRRERIIQSRQERYINISKM